MAYSEWQLNRLRDALRAYHAYTPTEDATEPTPGTVPVRHNGVVVLATPELAAALRDALVRNPVASLGWNGPTVPLTLEDATVLAWLRNNLGGVLTVAGGPQADTRRRR